MEGTDLKLTSFSRVSWTLTSLCFVLVVLSWWLFELSWCVLFCAVCGLGYCTTSFLCYQTDARWLRDKLDYGYELLFVWALDYKHTSVQSKDRSTTKTSNDAHHTTAQSKTNKTQVKAAALCHKEAQKMIQLIMKDFVHSWYSGVTSDDEFPEDVQKILEHVALEVNIRLQRIDLEDVVCEILTLIIPYLEVVNDAGMRDFNGVNIFDVNHEKCQREFESNPKVAHRALQSHEHQLKYYRQALDALIQCAAPTEYRNCDVACMFAREILLKNIIEPVFNLLCDTDFLYEAIPIILSKASVEKVEKELEDIRCENEELEKRLNHGRLVVKIKGSLSQQKRRFHMTSGRFDHSFNIDHSSFDTALPRSRSSADALSMAPPANGNRSPLVHVRSRAAYANPLGNSVNTHMSNSLPPEIETGVRVIEEPLEQVDNEVVFIQLPPIYIERHVRVDNGSSVHTAYIFKFPKRLLYYDERRELGVLETDTHLEAMKRYSEFEKLHSSLLKSPSLSPLVRGLELPEKRGFTSIVSKLPFTSSDPDPTLILERKQGLEKYLQSISSAEDIAHSELFHNFLMSGVKSLKEAFVVNPRNQHKFANKRKSFLGIVKHSSLATFGEETTSAEPIPKRPFEEVLSTYLNTHLPLPGHSFHSLNSIHTKQDRHTRTSVVAPNKRMSTLTEHAARPSVSPTPSLSLASTISLEQERPASKLGSLREPSLDEVDSKTAVEAVCGTEGTDGTAGVAMDHHVPFDEEESMTAGMAYSLLKSRGEDVTASNEHPNKSSPNPHTLDSVRAATTDTQNTTNSGSVSTFLLRFPGIRSMFSYLFETALQIFSLVGYVIQRGMTPITNSATLSLANEQKKKNPLSNALFSLGSEVSKRHCQELWACSENTQLALLVLVGGGMERFLWKELKEVVYREENWARALYHLRHTLWPNGKLMETSNKKVSEQERMELKRKAADAFKRFLPNFLPPLVGPGDYDKAVMHCLDCIQNPKMNRHFFLRVVDLLFLKLVPEMKDKSFQKQLATLRTLTQHRSRLGSGDM